MPTTPYARLGVRVNGAAPQYGGITVAHGDSVQFVAESTAFWGTPAAIWTIYEYPNGWSGPGSPWISQLIPQPNGLPDLEVFEYTGNTAPPAFTMPALPYWGKFMPSLKVNGGIKDGRLSDDLFDVATAVQILSPSSLVVVAFRELTQFGSWRSWAGALTQTIRAVQSALSGVGLLSNNTPAPIGTATPGVSGEASRSDHVHAVDTNLTFPAPSASTLSKAAGAGAGGSLSIRAANGAVGFAGGALTIGPGIGGTPDTDAPGALTIAMGSNGTNSGALSVTAGSLGAILGLQYLGGSTKVSLSTTKATLELTAATSQKFTISGTPEVTVTAGGLELDSGNVLSINGNTILSAPGDLPTFGNDSATGAAYRIGTGSHTFLRGGANVGLWNNTGVDLASGLAFLIDGVTLLTAPSGVATLGTDGSGKDVILRAGVGSADRFYVNSTLRVSVKTTGLDVESGHDLRINNVPILSAPGDVPTIGGDSGLGVRYRAATGESHSFMVNGGAVATASVGGFDIVSGGAFSIDTTPVLSETAASLAGNITVTATQIGVYGASATTKPTVTGAKGGNAALGSLLSALATIGWITDSTTA